MTFASHIKRHKVIQQIPGLFSDYSYLDTPKKSNWGFAKHFCV
ncbi:hypothetical protein PPL_04748 [Heterostelium album PN500]|uniref:Uncharacterized protein n=1 Tax=Heterostelium pallidum (strain ATCC 26659 / Pp 5 / PN500) TaxID=670386 RepID=D3B8F5_HETP5|nr:hypothetical protein PPL_04748 [Heterostelium album PN500]EFA82323.1 hypothetical protein PPL_04748 [Heterostelium album PN500]|eukprot:XP_020434440.1 hypothetical protein PPL_04748 [Heterostelium album PN500]